MNTQQYCVYICIYVHHTIVTVNTVTILCTTISTWIIQVGRTHLDQLGSTHLLIEFKLMHHHFSSYSLLLPVQIPQKWLHGLNWLAYNLLYYTTAGHPSKAGALQLYYSYAHDHILVNLFHHKICKLCTTLFSTQNIKKCITVKDCMFRNFTNSLHNHWKIHTLYKRG